MYVFQLKKIKHHALLVNRPQFKVNIVKSTLFDGKCGAGTFFALVFGE